MKTLLDTYSTKIIQISHTMDALNLSRELGLKAGIIGVKELEQLGAMLTRCCELRTKYVKLEVREGKMDNAKLYLTNDEIIETIRENK